MNIYVATVIVLGACCCHATAATKAATGSTESPRQLEREAKAEEVVPKDGALTPISEIAIGQTHDKGKSLPAPPSVSNCDGYLDNIKMASTQYVAWGSRLSVPQCIILQDSILAAISVGCPVRAAAIGQFDPYKTFTYCLQNYSAQLMEARR